MHAIKRRSASSNWISISNLLGNTPIPPELGTTVTGAISNLNNNPGEWVYLGQAGSTVTTISSTYGLSNISGLFAVFQSTTGTILNFDIIDDLSAMTILKDLLETDAGMRIDYGPNYAVIWMMSTSMTANTYTNGSSSTIVKIYIKPKI